VNTTPANSQRMVTRRATLRPGIDGDWFSSPWAAHVMALKIPGKYGSPPPSNSPDRLSRNQIRWAGTRRSRKAVPSQRSMVLEKMRAR
jgi:hypothetical protein